MDVSGWALLKTAGVGFALAKAWGLAAVGIGAALFAAASLAGAASSLLSLRPGAKPLSLLCPALAAAGMVIAAVGLIAVHSATAREFVSIGASPFFWVALVVCLGAGALVFLQRWQERRKSGDKEGFVLAPQEFGVTVVAAILGLAIVLPWVKGVSPIAFAEKASADTSDSGGPGGGRDAKYQEVADSAKQIAWGGLIFCVGAGLSAVVALVWVTSDFGTPKLAAGAAALGGVGMIWFLISAYRMKSAVDEILKARGITSGDTSMGFIWGFYVTAVVVLASCLVFLTAERN
jgi:hypothetical protein